MSGGKEDKRQLDKVPPFRALCRPVLRALQNNTDFISCRDLGEQVADLLTLSAQGRQKMQGSQPRSGEGRTEITYNTAWALTALKHRGLCFDKDNLWRATEDGRQVNAEEFELKETDGHAFLFAYNPRGHLKKERARMDIQAI